MELEDFKIGDIVYNDVVKYTPILEIKNGLIYLDAGRKLYLDNKETGERERHSVTEGWDAKYLTKITDEKV